MESTKKLFLGDNTCYTAFGPWSSRAVPMSWQPQYVVVNQRTYQSKGVFTELRYSVIVLTKTGILKSKM